MRYVILMNQKLNEDDLCASFAYAELIARLDFSVAVYASKKNAQNLRKRVQEFMLNVEIIEEITDSDNIILIDSHAIQNMEINKKLVTEIIVHQLIKQEEYENANITFVKDRLYLTEILNRYLLYQASLSQELISYIRNRIISGCLFVNEIDRKILKEFNILG